MQWREWKFAQITLIGGLALAGLALFQNCGKAGFDQDSGALSLQSGAADGFPFAFEASVDQISYNSCFGVSAQSRPGFYTLMAGAYGNGSGVRVTNAFMNYARSTLKPEQPNAPITNEQIKVALANSANSAGAQPQFALRTRQAPQSAPITPAASEPVEGRDYVSVLGDLSDDRWMDPLVKNPVAPTAYFNLAPSGRRNLEATLTYNTSEGMAEGMRISLMSNGHLTLTFKANAGEGFPYAARAPSATDPSKAYGRGYNLIFEPAIAPYTLLYNPAAQPHALNPSNTLTAIQEVDLANPAASGPVWTCPQSRRYVIVRAIDGATFCPRDPYSYLLTGIPSLGMSAEDYRREFEVARRALRAEHWDISVQFRCAVPKTNAGDCYPPEQGQVANAGIEYNQSQPCYQGLPNINYGSSIPVKRCAQYVSICTRN